MKKAMSIIKAIVLGILIAAGIHAIVGYFVTAEQGKIIDNLYDNNVGILNIEYLNRIKLNESLRKVDELTEFINEMQAAQVEKVNGLNNKVAYYKNKAFSDLKSCQTEYDNLFLDYELCVSLHIDAGVINSTKDSIISKLKTAIDLSQTNYDSCLKRVDNLEKIIDKKNKKSLSKNIKRYLIYIGIGAAIGYATSKR